MKGQCRNRSTKPRLNPAQQMSQSCTSVSPADGRAGNSTRPPRRRLMNFRDELQCPACEILRPAASYASQGHRWWHWGPALLQNTELRDANRQLCRRSSTGKASFGNFCYRKWRKGWARSCERQISLLFLCSWPRPWWSVVIWPECATNHYNGRSDWNGEVPLWSWMCKLTSRRIVTG